MQPLLNVAISAARLAGDLIIRYSDQLDRIQVTAKNENEYFSEVDIKAEQIIIHTILKAYPGHGIIAEESGNYNAEAESVWIIDPLDGSSNYLHGFPFYSVSIAHRVKNRIEHAVIYDPIRHECFSASRGRGAQLNERRIRVSKQTQLSNALLATTFPFKNSSLSPYWSSFNAIMEKSAGIRKAGSAALDMAYLASGRIDGLCALGLRLWDLAAGSLIIKEAGGLISNLQGHEDYMNYGDLIAGNPKIFKSLLQTLIMTGGEKSK